ncbi:MerR family transcriptional regulator [Blastococcus saxobsidens]|nr:MerR family transcriptional regulator [Blastococcus saxobsidens]
MPIGQFARAAGLTAEALRLCDETGLLRPAEVDARSGYRYYRDDQLDRARLVARLRLVGMPLDRIRFLAGLPAGARAAELLSWWRQVEADTASRRQVVGALVTDLRSERHDMTIEQTFRPVAAARAGTGSRERQLDAVLTGRHLHTVADGFGNDAGTARLALDALAGLDTASGTVDPVRLLDGAVLEAASVVARLPVEEGRLTEDEARADARRADLNRALVAGRTTAPDLSLHAVRPGDRFVLTTDGVHAVLPEDELARLLLDESDPDPVVAAVQDAIEAAGAPDNYAVVVVDLPADG